MDTAIFCPADFPKDCRLLPISLHGAKATRKLLAATRPDVTLVSTSDSLSSNDYLLASGPEFWSEIREARARGLTQPALIFPEHCTSYYDFWSFPIELLQTSGDGNLRVSLRDFTQFVTNLGGFFGRIANGQHEPEMRRYMPLRRASALDSRSQMEQILALLEDDESRTDYAMVVEAKPHALWRHWLRALYSGLEYMDYMVLAPGSVILNCGVHGGGEIPYFLAAMAGLGCVVNTDPLGHAYLSPYVHTALATSSAECHEICAALHDSPGTVDLLVEPNGMAQCVADTQPGTELRKFRAVTIDEISADLALERLDLIKMDIEGAELRALAGAWEAIERFRPQLAISICHKPEHFSELPLMLAQHLRLYRFFVRNYHFISNETIFYAIPMERPYRKRRSRIEISLE